MTREELMEKSQEWLVEKLVADDVETITQQLNEGDTWYLEQFLRGENLRGYSHFTLDELRTEYRNRELNEETE